MFQMLQRRLSSVVVALLVPLATATGFCQGPRTGADSTRSAQAAVIEDSGSTNTAGYHLVVQPSGAAQWAISPRKNSLRCPSNHGKLPADLTGRFFADIRSLMPLSNLPAGHCAKSVSFGTTLRISYEGSVSPDLTCPGNVDQTAKLLSDLAKIRSALGMNTGGIGGARTCEEPTPTPVH